MTLLKHLVQRIRPTTQPAAPEAQEPHPNFWMYQ